MKFAKLLKNILPMLGLRQSDQLAELLPPEAVDEVMRRVIIAAVPDADRPQLYAAALQYLAATDADPGPLCVVVYALNADNTPGEMLRVIPVPDLMGANTVGALLDTLEQFARK